MRQQNQVQFPRRVVGKVRRVITRYFPFLSMVWEQWWLSRLRKRMFEGYLSQDATVEFFDYKVQVTDGPNFYMQFKDEFIHRIYTFESARQDPLIIDGGSNVGMSILSFKRAYPRARIIGFEPDPSIFKILQKNLERNDLRDGITLVNAGLSAEDGTVTFVPDGSSGGQIGEGGTIQARMERLSSYLDEPVDFLKLNIEGEELPVLLEAAANGKLHNVSELVLEYHGWANGEQRLGDILNLLDRNGFRYMVHDFDNETCTASKPPFRFMSGANWFCLVYAKRRGKKGTAP